MRLAMPLPFRTTVQLLAGVNDPWVLATWNLLVSWPTPFLFCFQICYGNFESNFFPATVWKSEILNLLKLEFDRLLVSASSSQLPIDLIDQLIIGGKLVVPVGNSIFEIKKIKSGLKSLEHQGFVFVPLV